MRVKFVNILKNTFYINNCIRNLRFRGYGTTVQQPFDAVSENLNQKLLKVAIIGMPNAGKSTLINSLMDRRICATSKKVHTTRKATHAIFTRNDTQVVFLDTPGLVNERDIKKHSLEKLIVTDLNSSLYHADVVGVIHDVSDIWFQNRLGQKIVNILEKNIEKPSFLILNKIDLLKSKRKLLEISRLLTENHLSGNIVNMGVNKREIVDEEVQEEKYKGWRFFSDIFMTSALNVDGMEEIREYLLKNARPNPWMYNEEKWCNETPENLILQAVKAKILDFYPKEIPYKLKCELELFENVNGTIKAVVLVHCLNARLERKFLGPGNDTLKELTEEITKDLIDTFDENIEINITTSIPKKEAEAALQTKQNSIKK